MDSVTKQLYRHPVRTFLFKLSIHMKILCESRRRTAVIVNASDLAKEPARGPNAQHDAILPMACVTGPKTCQTAEVGFTWLNGRGVDEDLCPSFTTVFWTAWSYCILIGSYVSF